MRVKTVVVAAPAGVLILPAGRKGDQIRYTSQAFLPHTTSVLAKGAGKQPVAIPDPSGAIIQGVNDPTGRPLFFNGHSNWICNPSVWARIGDRNVSDRRTHSSGAMFPAPGADRPAPGTS